MCSKTKNLPSLLEKFRYQERTPSKVLKQVQKECSSKSSSDIFDTVPNSYEPSGDQSPFTAATPSSQSQDSEITCIPETPVSMPSSPRSPPSKQTNMLTNKHFRIMSDQSDSDSDCETPRTSRVAKTRPRKPAVRPQGDRKFRLVSTGSESSDSPSDEEETKPLSTSSLDARSTRPVFSGSVSTAKHTQPQDTSSTDSGRQTFKFNKSQNLVPKRPHSPLQYTALPSSSESDIDTTTLGSHSNKASNPSGLSDLETPPPTIKRKKKRRRILSEGQDSVDGESRDDAQDDLDKKRKDDVVQLQHMFPTWTTERLRGVLETADWCVDEAASIIASKESDDEQSGHVKSTMEKKVRRKKRRKVENISDKENSDQKWLSKSKMTAYFPTITKPGRENAQVKRRQPNKDVQSSEDETFSASSDSNEEVIEDSEEQAKMNQLILNFFNDASPEELLTISQCSKVKVKKIEAIRPFEDYNDLISKFDSTKGLSSTLVWNCSDVFQSQQLVTTLLDNCSKVADNIQSIVCKLLPDKDGVENSDKIEEGQIARQPALLAEKHTLKPYQMVGLNWLALMHRQGVNGILADEMGLGKTVQTIAFLAYLLEQGDGGPHLIVVPSSTLENWVRELHTWCPALEVILYTGSADERKELRNNILAEYLTCNVIISSYNMCISNVDDRSLFRKMGIHYAVFDEAHMLKNMQSQRYKFLMKIRAERKLLLTGTPLQNNLKELISLLSFVMPDMFCDSASELQKVFSLTKQKSDNPYEQSNFERKRIAHAKQIMLPFMLRRVKSEVLKQLPKKTEHIMKCPMTDTQEKRYNNIKAALSRDLRNLGNGAKMAATKLSCAIMQLRKAANHELLMRYHYDDAKLREMAKLMLKEPTHYDANSELIFEDMSVMFDYELHRLCHEYNVLTPFRLSQDILVTSGKFRILDDMLPDLKEKGDRVLMFSQFVMVLDIIEAYVKHHKYRFLRLDGQTPVGDRLALIDKYNNDEGIFVFLLSTRAGGLGINLTSANHVILHDIDYNPYNDKQAEDRCHRVGQLRDVTVTKLITSNSIEEGMLRCARYKLQLEQQMTTNDDTGEDAENATDIATLLKDALDLE